MKTSALTVALLDMAREGQRPPCGDPEAKPLFTSDHAEDREAAAYRCRRCPITAECLAEALETRATAGVWAGVDFEKLKPSTRRRMLAQLDANDHPDNTHESLF